MHQNSTGHHGSAEAADDVRKPVDKGRPEAYHGSTVMEVTQKKVGCPTVGAFTPLD